MSGFLSTRYLKYQRLRSSARIETDRHCLGCGYNLRGLMLGGSCPECGQSIAWTGPDDLLLSGTHEQRRSWHVGLGVAAFVLAAAVVARAALFVTGFFGVDPGVKLVYLSVALALSGAWAWSVWLMTPPRLAEHWPWMRPLRPFVRASQLLWPLAYAVWIVAALNQSQALELAMKLGRVVPGAGAIALAVILSRVAERSDLEDAARRLNAAAWFLPITALLPQAFPSSVAWFTGILLGIALAFWMWTMALYALGVFEMHRHLAWTQRHALDAMGRDERMRARRAEMDRELNATIRPVVPSERDVPLDP